MKIASSVNRLRQMPGESGIAIGPILFVIAVLGILAAAIAAGSGSFTTSTAGESNRTKAAAIIEIGQNIKIGMDRILSAGSFAIDQVSLDPTDTSDSNHLFSPIGGGIAAPSAAMAYLTSTSGSTPPDPWVYYYAAIPGIGRATATGGSLLAMLHVSAGVCDEINYRANGIAVPSNPGDSAGTDADFGDIGVANTATDVYDATGTGGWPEELSGKPTGCVHYVHSGATAPAVADGYYFYQVIAIQ